MKEEINKEEELNKGSKKLSFKDIFFISFGGQAPFISLLTFGTVMIGKVGNTSAICHVGRNSRSPI